MAVNAAAIPPDLIESALFGHEKGAFTSALRSHRGYCAQAHGGILFLDEIAEMDYRVQAKLLRFLQDHLVQRVGSSTPRKVYVRVLAATNAVPAEAIAGGRLREDLYYRLRMVSVEVPALRERPGDVTLLARHFLSRAERRHRHGFRRLVPEALSALESYSWPGNVRQLENVIEEAVVLHRGKDLERSMLPTEVLQPGRHRPAAAGFGVPPAANLPAEPTPAEPSPGLSEEEEDERRKVADALEEAGDDPVAAARRLDISRATIYLRMKKYGLGRRRS